jgi:hypothetical protein
MCKYWVTHQGMSKTVHEYHDKFMNWCNVVVACGRQFDLQSTVVDSILAETCANQLTASDAWLKWAKQQGLKQLKAMMFIMNSDQAQPVHKANQEAQEWLSAWKQQLADWFQFSVHLT